MRFLPPRLVERLPIDWWRPGNLRRFGLFEIHYCDDDRVRTIELNDRVVAQGPPLFPYAYGEDE